jgi:NADH-quinone oxidoreductase subunit L
MFIAIGIGAYNVAIFHLFTHAFFKALLFLGAGSVIHSLNNEQNLDKMGGLWKKMPYTWILMIVGTLALTGFPLLSGYYSKDAIIEFAYLRGSFLAYLSAGIGILTAILTSIYSWRLIFKTFHGSYNNENCVYEKIHESPKSMMLPLILLALGSIFAGVFFKDLFIGYDSDLIFWKNSIFFISEVSKDHPPFWFLILTPVFVTIMIPISYYLFIINKNIPKYLAEENKSVYDFLINKWYFDEIYDYIFVQPAKKIGIFLWKVIDLKTIDRFGPDGISNFIKFLSNKAVKFQSGYIYHYAFVMLIGVSILLTYLMVY